MQVACGNACPSTESFEAIQAQNWGCLPCPAEINQMLTQKRVWMCHSNPKVPCVATGLSKLPKGFVAEPETVCPVDTVRL